MVVGKKINRFRLFKILIILNSFLGSFLMGLSMIVFEKAPSIPNRMTLDVKSSLESSAERPYEE